MALDQLLTKYGMLMEASIKTDVGKVSATGKTAASVHFRVIKTKEGWQLQVLGRKFFSALETGRGPRKSNEYGEFDLNLEEYMQARGIGAGLSLKKRQQLAKYLALKINREGDSVFKSGGRQVYSQNLNKIVAQLVAEIKNDFTYFVVNFIRNEFTAS